MAAPSDEEILAELGGMLTSGRQSAPSSTAAPAQSAPTETPPPAVATETPPPAVATETPPPAEAPAAKPFELDVETQQRIASVRRVQEQIQRERQQLQQERAQAASERQAAERLAQLERLAKSGKSAALLQALGVVPAKDHAEDVYAAALGDDAPGELKLRAQQSQLRREIDELRAQITQRDRDAEERAGREAAERQAAQQREYVRAQLLPQWAERTAIVHALAADPEFADSVIGTGLQRYQTMAAVGETDPLAAFTAVEQQLERMLIRALESAPVQARVTKALEAKKPKQPVPAEKPQPAPTLSKQFTSTTPPPTATDAEAYGKQVLEELKELMRR